jgi:hypothetical protein
MLVDVLAKSGEAAKSGPIGLAVILILCIVCYFLFKSMSKHLRKVREEYPAGPAAHDGDAGGAAGGSVGGDAPAPGAQPPAERGTE